MRNLILSIALASPLLALAQSSVITGEFADKSTPGGRPIFSVRSDGDSLTLTYRQDGSIVKLPMMNELERKAMFQTLALDQEVGSYSTAECAGSPHEFVCYAPTPPSASGKSGQKAPATFFHFDKMGGLTELRKIVKK